MNWKFWIDVGGTFTDCIGYGPNGVLHQSKVLSSGLVQGRGILNTETLVLTDSARNIDPTKFWNGADCQLIDDAGMSFASLKVAHHDPTRGELYLSQPSDEPHPNWTQATVNLLSQPSLTPQQVSICYQLNVHLPAPVLAIRQILQLSVDEPCPPVRIRFGTTRGTNALLTRTGAKTLFITTRGFADAPVIGNQSRPDLFALSIQKPLVLFSDVIEIDERIAANGTVLRPFKADDSDPATIQLMNSLQAFRANGFDSVAICLMNAYANDAHERMVEQLVRAAGFDEVSRSTEVSPLIRFIPRCDTTTLDAYLNPVLRTYVSTLRSQLPDSDIQVMTSFGGLVESRNFRGRDSILSGPAGGITGFASVAQAEGFRRAIGFDMGGTSTDVARYEGQFEYENETTRAGVRIMTPMLAIETVAAGGGSICGFDGVRLFVGPQSAGAAPGPACYGAGGPLTVTDLNMFLGRVPSHYFPFQLDLPAVQKRLGELYEDMQQRNALGQLATQHELAEGLLRIANDNMANAIRRVSIAKGYDPADYVLVSFGGAGGQHACQVAASLGIRQVLIHPMAGVLSAYGMGMADVRAIRQQSVLKPLCNTTLSDLKPDIERLILETHTEVTAQGTAEIAIRPPKQFAELRYMGTDSTIQVDLAPSSDQLRRSFEREHQRLYGYSRANRPIEIASITIETIGQSSITSYSTSGSERAAQEIATTPSERGEITKAWFDGIEHKTPIHHRRDLFEGQQITGPAIICEPTSTIVIDPACKATIQQSGAVLIDITKPRQSPLQHTATKFADPIQLEIFSNQFTSIAEQMGEMLRRTSISTNVRERLDYSCALFDVDGQLVVNAPHVPVHLGAMGETVRAVIADHPAMRPGDVFVTNDPYRGGSHLPDVTVITPVFVEGKEEPAFYTANRAHHAEIGGIRPGSMPPMSTNLAEEGVLIRSRKLVNAGRSCEDELRELLTSGPYPSRSVDDNLADLAAQVAANECGGQLLRQLVNSASLDAVFGSMKQLQEAAATKMKQALSRLGDWSQTFTDYLDDNTPITVKITIQHGHATVDFTGSGDVHPGNLNANRAITTSATLYTMRCLLGEDVPLNAGVLHPITLIIPTGILNPPEGLSAETTPAVVGGNVETSQRIVNALFGALELAAASQGTMNNLTFGDNEFGYYETICGGAGATATSNGADAVHTHMTNTRLTDPEILEQRYPVRLRQFSIRRGSGGTGQFRGGDGIIREIEFLRPVDVSMLCQSFIHAPYGLHGGRPGMTGINELFSPAYGKFKPVGGSFHGTVDAGCILRIQTPGGGGWGMPAL